MGKLYRLVLSDNPCDICQSMEGIYDFEPDVPFHPHCVCQVEEVDPEDADDLGDISDLVSFDENFDDDSDFDFDDRGLECETEIRNMECQEETFTRTSSGQIVFDEPAPEDVEYEIVIEPETLESWDHHLAEDAANLDALPDSFTVKVEVPKGTSGTVHFEIEFTYKQVICSGELWEICRRADVDPDNARTFSHIHTEKKIDMVGGGYEGLIDAEINNVDFDADPPKPEDNPVPYFEDDDEVPV